MIKSSIVGAVQLGEGESPAEKAKRKSKRSSRRHVWVLKNDLLEAIEVEVGFSESRYTIVTIVNAGEITEGMALVTGVKRGR